jgi:hypothetical protein
MAPLRQCGYGGRRLAIPAELPTTLGYDAVGMPPEEGKRVMDGLPRVGCVFTDDQVWWWIVPTGSNLGVRWPSFTRYSVGAYVTAPGAAPSARPHRPSLIHHPRGNSPYTPPIPLFFLTCHIAGVTPSWSLDAGS